MKTNNNVELIRSIVSFDIINVDERTNNVYLDIGKNGEELVIVFHNKQAVKSFCKHTFRQNVFGVLNKPTVQPILSTMVERNCNWLLADNNLNFVQCFNDKDYNQVCKDSKQSFLRDKEKWAVGRRLPDNKVQLVDDDSVHFYSHTKVGDRQKVFLMGEDEFVYVEKEAARVLLPSEMMYLFHKSGKNQLTLNLIFNKSWVYEK